MAEHYPDGNYDLILPFAAARYTRSPTSMVKTRLALIQMLKIK